MSSSRSPTPTRNIPPGTLPIILAQFYQPHGGEHWTLSVVESSQSIHTFEIRGNTDSYTYVHDQMKNLDRVESYRGGCHVGNVPKDNVTEMRLKLKEVIINKHEPRWNPQVWVLDAIKLLKDEGWAFTGLTEVFTRRELQKDMLRWDMVEDTVYERVLQELDTGRPVSPAMVALSAEEGKPTSPTAAPKAKS
ncbi:hypothetical protein D9756_009774 [Leucocoprinus leucothites]|uniref:Uncharacterized protein n=1 Tax=Leucocoprinus leucothites TaxID=201217 RepID=A0A8H5CVP5_9AGAR|nr:hypothetical protein D9756_009774 [Leucoagaricus leucothites]